MFNPSLFRNEFLVDTFLVTMIWDFYGGAIASPPTNSSPGGGRGGPGGPGPGPGGKGGKLKSLNVDCGEGLAEGYLVDMTARH